MKIGIDIDGVLIDFEEKLRCKAEIYDFIERKNIDLKYNNNYWVQDKYEWSEDEWNYFRKEYLLELTKESCIKPGAKEILDLLKKERNELVVISARGINFPEMITLVEEKIKNANIIFDKYYWKRQDKLEICKNEKIDVMIDDNQNTCEKLSRNNIRTLYFRNIYGKQIPKNKYLTEVYDWGNVYRNLGMLKN